MSRLGSSTLFRRQLLADWGAAATVVIVVVTVAGLLAGWPRAIDQMFTDDVRDTVTNTAPGPRDLTGRVLLDVPQVGPDASSAQVYAQLNRNLHAARSEAPLLARQLMGDPQYQLVAASGLTAPVPEHLRDVELTPLADPRFAGHIRIVDGELPTGVTVSETVDLDLINQRFVADVQNNPAFLAEVDLFTRTFDIALSAETAERVVWEIGEVRQLVDPAQYFGPPSLLRLTGTFEAVDPDAEYWSHSLGVLDPFEEFDPDLGTTVFPRAFMPPAAMAAGTLQQVNAQIWFPVDGSSLDANNAPLVLDQLREYQAQAHFVSLGENPQLAAPALLRLSTGLTERLDDALSRQSSAAALLALVAAGPFGVALAVLALGSRLVVERRRRTMALVSARGASRRQLRILLALEGALLGVPAAAAAVVVAAWLLPGRGGPVGVVLPLVVGLAPMVLLPFIAKPGSPAGQRADLGRRRGLVRWSFEVVVVTLAAAAVALLNQRGLSAGGPGQGVDVLLVAAPLLVALAVGVVVLRLYPVPVAALGRFLRARPGIVGYIGTARAVRDPAAGLAPVLALVVGLAVATFSTVLWSTTQSAGATESTLRIGADLAVSGPPVNEEQRAALEELDGIAAATLVTGYSREDVVVGNRTNWSRVFVADTSELAEIQADLPDVPEIAAGMDSVGGAVPVMVPSDFARPGDRGVLDVGDGVPIVVAGVADRIAGLSETLNWILIDEAAWADVYGGRMEPARLVLADAEPGAVIDTGSVQEALDSAAPVQTASDVLAAVRAGAVGNGLIVSFVVAIVVVGALCVTAVLLTMVIAAPSRARLLSQLRTLGFTGRQAECLTTWEVAPLAVVSLVFGLGLGLGIPALVFSALDLRPLTGAAAQPPVAVDWLLVLGAAGIFILIVAGAVAVAVATSRRVQLGAVLRVGEAD